MTLDKQKLINAMAIPLHEGHSCMTWEEAKRLAETSFAALQDYMPNQYRQLTNEVISRMTIDELSAHPDGCELWDELKTLGK